MYYEFFSNCTNLTATPQIKNDKTLIMDPDDQNDFYGFAAMFSNCKNLSAVNNISIHFDGKITFTNMFEGCAALVNPPDISTLSGNYGSTFSSCKNLTKAPFFPAPNLLKHMFVKTFRGCKNLSAIEVKFIEWTLNGTNNGSSNSGWFEGVSWNESIPHIFIKPEELPIIRSTWHIPAIMVVLNRINGNLYFAEDTEWDGIQYSAGDIYPGEDPYAEYY